MAAWIVLVDDDYSVRRSLPRLLRGAGFDTCAFASADELVASGSAKTAACLIVDVRLGWTSGFDLVERLRKDGVTAPVVFITAHDDAESRGTAERLGAFAYLRKPFEASALLDLVAAAVGDPGGDGEEAYLPRPP